MPETRYHPDKLLISSMTVAHTLTCITFHLINDKAMREKLQAELKDAIDEVGPQPTWTQLEQLPYLVRRPQPPSPSIFLFLTISQSAIIQEGLR